MQIFSWPWIMIMFPLTFMIVAGLGSISINIKFLRENNKNNLDVTFKFLLIKYTKKIIPRKGEKKPGEYIWQEEDESKNEKGVNVILSPGLKHYRELLEIFLRYSRWQKLNARLIIGSGDSFSTGLGAGVAWAMGGNLVAFMNRNLKFRKNRPVFNVIPDFAGSGLAVDIDAAFSIRGVYLGFMLAKLLKTIFIVFKKTKEVSTGYGQESSH